jgi:hypothetical protein
MRHSRRLAAGAAVLAGIALAVAVGTEAAQQKSCSLTGSRTVYANPDVRVFVKVVDAQQHARTVACRKSDGARFVLAEDSGTTVESVDLLGEVGRILGYAVFRNGKTVSYGKACLLNVKAGRKRCQFTEKVRGLGVTRAGSLAWLADTNVDGACCAVHKLDAGAAHPVALDGATDIDPTSFAVGGSHIYWIRAGAVQTADMP